MDGLIEWARQGGQLRNLHDDDPVEDVGEDQPLRYALCMVDVGSGSVHLESSKVAIARWSDGLNTKAYQDNGRRQKINGRPTPFKPVGVC